LANKKKAANLLLQTCFLERGGVSQQSRTSRLNLTIRCLTWFETKIFNVLETWRKRLNRCMNVKGDYFEGDRSQIK